MRKINIEYQVRENKRNINDESGKLKKVQIRKKVIEKEQISTRERR